MLKTLLTLRVLSTKGFVCRGLATNPLWGLGHVFLSQAPALHLLKGEDLKGHPSPAQFLLSTGHLWAGRESEVIFTSSQQKTQGVLQPIWLPVPRTSRVHDLLVLGMRYTAILP